MAVLDTAVKDKALAAVKTLGRLGRVRAAYVFGSHVEGRANQWSDIDLAAFMEGIDDWDVRQRAKAMASVMMEVGSDVETHLFSVSALKQPERGGFAEYILQRGIRVE